MSRTETVDFEDVVELLEEWDPTFHSYTVAEERMQVYLDRALNPDPVEVPDRTTVQLPTEPTECDVVVGEAIGVNIYRRFRKREQAEFRRQLQNCEQDWVVMYAHDLPTNDSSRDQWRWTKSRYSGGRGHVEDIRFVHNVPDEETDGGLSQVLLESPEAVLFGTLALVVGIALLVGSTTSRESFVGGPVITSLVAVICILLLVLLWTMTED